MRCLIIVATFAIGCTAALAEPLVTGSSSSSFASKLKVLDSRAATQYKGSARLRPETYTTTAVPKYTGSYQGVYLEQARVAARQYDIPEDLFLRLVQRESNWDPNAKSHKGALGLAQLMPQTAAGLGVDPTDPVENLLGGAKYLAQQYRDFGTWHLALAAYNAGPEAVRRHGGIPPYKETQTYVRVILGS